jgi:hypothetical protein
MRGFSMIRLFLITMTLALSACGTYATSIGVNRYTEPNGYVERGHKAFGGLYYNGFQICGITLIRKNVAITARHCMDEWGQEPVLVGYFAEFDGHYYAITSSYDFPGLDLPGRTDISVVTLQSNVVGVKPIPVATSYPANGAKLLFLGRGCSPYGSVGDMTAMYPAGTKRSLEFTLRGDLMYNHLISADLRLCPGDSGGALINKVDYTLVGVGSAMGFWKDSAGKVHYAYAMFADPILFTTLIRFFDVIHEFRHFGIIAGYLQ